MKAGQTDWRPLDKTIGVCAGDKVETRAKTKIGIAFPGGNVLNLGPNTKIRISKMHVEAKKKQSLIDLIYGSLRSLVKESYKGSSNEYFRVQTKATVVGVRGTDFLVVHSDNAGSEVVTFEGKVQAYPIDKRGKRGKPVVIEAGNQLRLQKGKKVGKPQKLTKEKLDGLKMSSRIENKNQANEKNGREATDRAGKSKKNLRRQFENKQRIPTPQGTARQTEKAVRDKLGRKNAPGSARKEAAPKPPKRPPEEVSPGDRSGQQPPQQKPPKPKGSKPPPPNS